MLLGVHPIGFYAWFHEPKNLRAKDAVYLLGSPNSFGWKAALFMATAKFI